MNKYNLGDLLIAKNSLHEQVCASLKEVAVGTHRLMGLYSWEGGQWESGEMFLVADVIEKNPNKKIEGGFRIEGITNPSKCYEWIHPETLDYCFTSQSV